MPKDNIERAIARGSGADADGAAFETVMYEGYGPAGVAVIIEALTDNRNRTASDVRAALSQPGGGPGGAETLSLLFHPPGGVRFSPPGAHPPRMPGTAAQGGAPEPPRANGG